MLFLSSLTHLGLYSWVDVSKRTEVVYRNMLNMKMPSLATRFLRYLSAGPWVGNVLFNPQPSKLNHVVFLLDIGWSAVMLHNGRDVSII